MYAELCEDLLNNEKPYLVKQILNLKKKLNEAETEKKDLLEHADEAELKVKTSEDMLQEDQLKNKLLNQKYLQLKRQVEELTKALEDEKKNANADRYVRPRSWLDYLQRRTLCYSPVDITLYLE